MCFGKSGQDTILHILFMYLNNFCELPRYCTNKTCTLVIIIRIKEPGRMFLINKENI